MNQFMKLAIEEARKGFNSNHGGPFGAMIVRDGVLLANAHNEEYGHETSETLEKVKAGFLAELEHSTTERIGGFA